MIPQRGNDECRHVHFIDDGKHEGRVAQYHTLMNLKYGLQLFTTILASHPLSHPPAQVVINE